MDATVRWSRWGGLIEPSTYSGWRCRKPQSLTMMLRMYLLQAWFSLSDECVEDALCDSYAMRRVLGLNFIIELVPDAMTLLHFRHLLDLTYPRLVCNVNPVSWPMFMRVVAV